MYAAIRISVFSTLVLLSLLLLPGPADVYAQQLEVSFESVDYSQLPRVTFKACVREDQIIVRGLDTSRMTLLENGVPQRLSIRCPDPTEINSVVLVLDNSGSMAGGPLINLTEASKRLVDSLGPNDECAILTFGRGIVLAQDFTTDKVRLKNELDRMTAFNGTPLFDASYEACGVLQPRTGNRHAVIITDGEDTQSTHVVEDVITLANQIKARLHTIAFDIDPDYQAVMEQMAVETGGVFFSVARPSELTAVYEKIADIITEPCCIAEYTSTNCVDTSRSLLLSVTHNGRTAMAVQDFYSPSRAANTMLTVDVPTDMTPLATDRGFIDITPIPSSELALSLSFILEYDQNLVDIATLPFSFGTLTQNQEVVMTRVAPGAMRFLLKDIRPALATTRLVGFPIQALAADSSRYVHFQIRDAQIEGCQTEFSYTDDSLLICQCYRSLDVVMDSILTLTAKEAVLIPLRVLRGVETAMQLQATVRFMLPADIEDVDVLPGTLLPEDALDWRRNGDSFELYTPTSVFPKDTAGLLATLRIGPNRSPNVRIFSIQLIDSELWQRCCPEGGPTPSLTVLQEGRCEFIIRERAQTVKMANAPNPFSSRDGARTWITLEVPSGSAGESFVLDILDSGGRQLRRLHDGLLSEGEMRISFDAEGLPSGVYHAVLQCESGAVTRAMLYVR
ncbi:MAG: VWA domain-containing protein [Bacteroidetes bacterium]|nr:VWA domain-containing protein [Bacteroidota bacterium]